MRKAKPLIVGRVPSSGRVRPDYQRIDDGILAVPFQDDQRVESDADMKAFIKASQGKDSRQP